MSKKTRVRLSFYEVTMLDESNKGRVIRVPFVTFQVRSGNGAWLYVSPRFFYLEIAMLQIKDYSKNGRSSLKKALKKMKGKLP